MDNKILLGLAVLVVLGVVGITQLGSADLVTGMMGTKMMGSHGSGFMLFFIVVKLVSLAVVTFMVSAIFWWTKKLILGKK